MKKKIILLTGSSGFIGKIFLKNALFNGYEVLDILRKKNQNNQELKFLRKKYNQSYHSIFYSKTEELNYKLKNKKIDYFINFATLYKSNHSHKEIPSFINSNIIFPVTILDIIHSKVKKIINLGTMMQHTNGKDYIPKNFYASTKSGFEMILKFYTSRNKNLKFYNLKFFESFGEFDKRKKLIPTLIKNYKQNLQTKIISSKLELNIIHVNDIINGINISLQKNFKSGDYCLKHSKNIKINDLISKINKNLKRKIKIKFMSNKIEKKITNRIQILPSWKADLNLQKKIENKFYNENY